MSESETRMMIEWEDEQDRDETWTIEDDSAAGWAVRKIAEKQAQRDREVEWHKEQIERAKVRCDNDVAWLTMKLEEYSERLPMRETKTQYSFPVPGGKLIRQKPKQELFLVDEAAALAALEEDGRDDLIKVKKSVDWAGLKKESKDTGELLPGVELRDVPEKFVVRPDTAENN